MYLNEGQKWDLEHEVRKRDWEVLPIRNKQNKNIYKTLICLKMNTQKQVFCHPFLILIFHLIQKPIFFYYFCFKPKSWKILNQKTNKINQKPTTEIKLFIIYRLFFYKFTLREMPFWQNVDYLFKHFEKKTKINFHLGQNLIFFLVIITRHFIHKKFIIHKHTHSHIHWTLHFLHPNMIWFVFFLLNFKTFKPINKKKKTKES